MREQTKNFTFFHLLGNWTNLFLIFTFFINETFSAIGLAVLFSAVPVYILFIGIKQPDKLEGLMCKLTQQYTCMLNYGILPKLLK